MSKQREGGSETRLQWGSGRAAMLGHEWGHGMDALGRGTRQPGRDPKRQVRETVLSRQWCAQASVDAKVEEDVEEHCRTRKGTCRPW